MATDLCISLSIDLFCTTYGRECNIYMSGIHVNICETKHKSTLANRSNIKRLSISTTFWNRCFSISFLLLNGCALGGPQSIVGFMVLIYKNKDIIDTIRKIINKY